MLRKISAALLAAALLTTTSFANETVDMASLEEDYLPAAVTVSENLPATSAILIETSTGRVLFEKNADQKMPPASITKIMTLLLVMEALDSGRITINDPVSCSPHASSMGGSQIWFEPNELMTVDELLRAAAIASANDASVALGEHIAGSEDTFVAMMNKRAAELGMTNTTFKNACGLDAEGHLTTARDISTMSKALLSHPAITQYTSVWMDELRGGKTQLVNTNKLVRFYEGANGLKTGTTDGAGFCLSASATRNGLTLVAVVLGAKSSDDRFSSARGLLDYGFANYASVAPPDLSAKLTPVKVLGGVLREAKIKGEAPASLVVPKGSEAKLTGRVEMAADLKAPVEEGQTVGKVTVMLGEEVICEYPVKTTHAVAKMTPLSAFYILWNEATCMGKKE